MTTPWAARSTRRTDDTDHTTPAKRRRKPRRRGSMVAGGTPEFDERLGRYVKRRKR